MKDRVRLRAGMLREVITIQQPVVTAGIQKWATLATVRGAWETLQGSEQAQGGLQPPNIRMTSVTIRHPKGSFAVLPRMRLAFDGRTLEIDSVDPDQWRESMILTCREVTS
jgi:SPP1 family predicted phage head-tail adaptor